VWWERLNHEQKEAVGAPLGPVRVAAGPGSGKTAVLAARVAHLIGVQNVDPGKISCITFTNRAAGEMRSRVLDYLAGDKALVGRMYIGTFHGLGAKFLRRWMPQARPALEGGIVRQGRKDFLIYGQDEQLKVARRVLQAKQGSIGGSELLREVSLYKRRFGNGNNDYRKPDPQTLSLVNSYNQQLQQCNAVDLDDLVYLPLLTLMNHKSARDAVHLRHRHLLVDEFQDVSATELQLLNYLSPVRNESPRDDCSLFVVGDENQAIYGWRGADVRSALTFHELYPDASVYPLHINYRSHPDIVKASLKVLGLPFEESQGQKALYNDGMSSVGAVTVLGVHMGYELLDVKRRDFERIRNYSHQKEARAISAGWILPVIKKNSKASIAILCRTRSQCGPYELALTESGIPVRPLYSHGLFSRVEVKDLIAFLRLVANIDDEAAIERIHNVPRRNIGEKTWGAIRDAAKRSNVSIGRYLCENLLELREGQGISGVSSGVRYQGVLELAEILTKLTDLSKQKLSEITTMKLVEDVIEICGYHTVVEQRSKSARMKAEQRDADASGVEEAGQESKQLVDHILRMADNFDRQDSVVDMGTERSEMTVGDQVSNFVEQILLAGEPTVSKDSASTKYVPVTIGTIHSAKGMEFDVVVIAGVVEGLLPHFNSKTKDELEEERRVLYVAMTRAKEQLALVTRAFEPSVFLDPLRAPDSQILWDGI